MLIDLIGNQNIGIADVVVYILSALAVIFLTLPVHEFAHGFVAEKLGDKTPRWQGRITLNPFAHIDWLGAACVILFGFGWAKPVVVNANNFRNPKRDMAIVALAGPVSNMIVAFACLLFCNILYILPITSLAVWNILSYIILFFSQIAWINVCLAVFNLIPVPPFDGSRLLTVVLPYKYYNLLMRYEQYIYLGVLLLLFTNVLDAPLSFLSGGLYSGISFVAGLPFRIFGIG